ncbi:hypothetical protein QFZ35_003148 [Arthrobacter ulcerisalmonis]|nr:hypothetical protein [Arthrobacter ulcerisalmonis]
MSPNHTERHQRLWSVHLVLGATKTTSNGTLVQALAAAGQGSSLVIEHPQFGLNNIPLLHNGEPLVVDLYAGWEADHYAAEELSTLARGLGAWMQRHWQATSEDTLDRSSALPPVVETPARDLSSS